ncbi:hypothetical protein PsYK624_041450 [Phanerochaete sordida]|uniref:Ig-like domain-containing protein n=1 Tax=Phanerochaete sordida TaxID=48140 RepID=A0A9P3LBP9_9APHY|nr:hypothetical protein PsYK624_041450 [Phanerochaete sordida]
MPLPIPLLALALAGAAHATYHTAAAPATLQVWYQPGPVPLGQNLTLGCDAPGALVPPAAALAWNTSVAVRVPDGTLVGLGSAYAPGGCAWPGGGPAGSATGTATGAVVGDGGPPWNFVLDTGAVGQSGTYTAVFNQTYGTVPGVGAANATACDASRLVYQSWVFSLNLTVAPASASPEANSNFTTFTLKPAPTGKVLIENGAAITRISVAMLVGAVGVVVLRLF